jgi:hypothetical protein
MLPSFNTARKRSKTVALAFGEFSWRNAPDFASETDGNFDGVVRRPFEKKNKDLEGNYLVGDALINEMCDECGCGMANSL